jgi:hypothetical protein
VTKPVYIEHYSIVRARKMRRRALYRWSLGMALGAIVMLGGLAGCASAEPYYPGADMGPHDGALTGWKAPVVVSFDTQAAVTARCERLDPPKRRDMQGRSCAEFRNNLCTVHIAAPSSHRDVLTYAKLHHELLHCKLGDWHD